MRENLNDVMMEDQQHNRRLNALHNASNPNQGGAKRILCVCSAGLLRSPTLAGELYKRGYNTRAAGVHDYALVLVDEVLLHWADEVIFVSAGLRQHVNLPEDVVAVELNIPDVYQWRHPALVTIINKILDKLGY